MLEESRKFQIPDVSGRGKNVNIIVNWSKTPQVRGSKAIKFQIEGEEAVVKTEHLNSILFIIGEESVQKKLIPQKMAKARHFQRVVEVEARKDIKKGEKIKFAMEFTQPLDEQEILGSPKK